MKKVLLTTTAVVFTAGFASAGDMSMSGAIKLTYGGFGTGSIEGADNAFTSEADLDVAASSSSGSFSVSGTLEMDESGEDAAAVTISTGSFSFTYDENDIGALAVSADTGNNTPADNTTAYAAAAADGEDDNYGDYSISYTAGGLSVGYVGDDDSDDSVMTVGYATGALSLSMEIEDLTDTMTGTASNTTTTSATYVTGPYTIGLSADDADGWDASVAMASGDTTVTVAADETLKTQSLRYLSAFVFQKVTYKHKYKRGGQKATPKKFYIFVKLECERYANFHFVLSVCFTSDSNISVNICCRNYCVSFITKTISIT